MLGADQRGEFGTDLSPLLPTVGRSANGPQLRSAGTKPLGQKNRLAAAGTRHFFRAQSRGRRKELLPVGSSSHPSHPPLSVPLCMFEGWLPRRSAWLSPHLTNQLPCAQHETWSPELPLAKVAGRGTAREPGRWCHGKSSPRSLGMSSSTRLKARHMEQPRTAVLSSRLPSSVHPDSLCPTESTASWLRSTWTQFSADSSQAKLRPPPRGDGTRGPLSEMRIWNACFCSRAELARPARACVGFGPWPVCCSNSNYEK